MRFIVFTLAALVFGGPRARCAAAGAQLLLAGNGRSLAPIVISAKAGEKTRLAAADLAATLQKVTGAKFEVKEAVSGRPAQGILVGTLAEFPDGALAKPLQMRGFDGREAFAIRTDAKRLRLIGATDLGASHAAYRFLESIGCRWLTPAPEWEVLPKLPHLSVNVNETDRPTILARRIWYGWGLFPQERPSEPHRSAQDYAAWARRNRMAQSFTINCGHAWEGIILDNKTLFEQHPEYLALTGGKRQGWQLCVSNPAVRELATRTALEFFKKHPDADMASMECSDGDGQCECAKCAKLGSISDRVFGLANEVAKAVGRDYPGKMVGLYAYNQHCEPPSFTLEPNVYVQLTAGFIRGKYSFAELMELWPKRCRNMGFYEYFSVWAWDFDRLPGGRAADTGYLRKQIPRYAALGATSLDCESGNNWGPHGRGYYLANRLMWNPKVDADALLVDFYEKAFGPGAAPMKRYFERLDPSNKPLLSEHLLGLAFRDVEEASRLAAGRADVQARLDHIKQYLRYIHLRWMLDRTTDKARKKELALATLTHAYRTRHSYMNHWEAIRQAWTPELAKEFGEPLWSFTGAEGARPWAVDRPLTHEETEAAFREGLAAFKPVTVTELRFSEELVPVEFPERPNADVPPESRQGYQGGVPYALYSIRGEALNFSITTGTIAWYRDRAPARWSVLDSSGKRIAGDRLPLDGQAHPLEVKVPRAGRYLLEVDDSSAGWEMRVPSGRKAVILLQRERGFAHGGWMQPMYFYVPKGTRELVYYWSGGPHWVHDPDGAKVMEVEKSGAFIHVPVPAGADGKTWHFTRLALGHLWFFNAPNVLAASPSALLLPKDVAVRDKVFLRR